MSIEKLIEGYQRFQSDKMDRKKFQVLATEGQKPQVMVIACADSRVDPAILLDCDPGDIFVVRNVANLVPPYQSDPRHEGTSAALQFAVLGLGVTDIIVLGHSDCGGIKALMQSSKDLGKTDSIGQWMAVAAPAKQQICQQYPQATFQQQCHHCEHASLLKSLDNLTTFPWIAERLDAGQLQLHGWYFDLSQAVLKAYQLDKKQFVVL